MNATSEEAKAGQAAYTKLTLAMYDFVVLGVSNRFIWECPTPGLLNHYNRHVTADHLDIGVGTGYFLDRCKFPSATPRIALMDLNPDTLQFTSRRIARYAPTTYLRNVLEPFSVDEPHFESVGLGYLLHCLPGSMESKSVVFDHIRPLVNLNGVVFGATLLQGGVERSWLAKRLMAFYNKTGIFTNDRDHLDSLRHCLRLRFRDVSVETMGCVALFSGRV
jgi:hypothetical protein